MSEYFVFTSHVIIKLTILLLCYNILSWYVDKLFMFVAFYHLLVSLFKSIGCINAIIDLFPGRNIRSKELPLIWTNFGLEQVQHLLSDVFTSLGLPFIFLISTRCQTTLCPNVSVNQGFVHIPYSQKTQKSLQILLEIKDH